MLDRVEILQQEFINDLAEDKSLSFLVSKWILDRIPYIFFDNNEQCIEWKEMLSRNINIDSKAIIIAGSACSGFSFNPFKDYRFFREESDIDIAVISNNYFQEAWHYMRNMSIRHRYGISGMQRTAIDEHKNQLIYWGVIDTEKILEILPFGREWILALTDLSQQAPIDGREIKIRIYKDFESLRDYHIYNFRKLKEQLMEGGTRT